jgi:hypothetical protein
MNIFRKIIVPLCFLTVYTVQPESFVTQSRKKGPSLGRMKESCCKELAHLTRAAASLISELACTTHDMVTQVESIAQGSDGMNRQEIQDLSAALEKGRAALEMCIDDTKMLRKKIRKTKVECEKND